MALLREPAIGRLGIRYKIGYLFVGILLAKKVSLDTKQFVKCARACNITISSLAQSNVDNFELDCVSRFAVSCTHCLHCLSCVHLMQRQPECNLQGLKGHGLQIPLMLYNK